MEELEEAMTETGADGVETAVLELPSSVVDGSGTIVSLRALRGNAKAEPAKAATKATEKCILNRLRKS